MAEQPHVVVQFTPRQEERESVTEVLGPIAKVTFLTDLADEDRAPALKSATVLFARRMAAELKPGEIEMLKDVKLIQEHGAGVDFMPFARLPEGATIVSNAGATAEPIAEHILALILALSKRIVPNHQRMSNMDFPQGQLNKSMADSVCAILGYGGIGKATAKLLRPFGTKIYAVNTSGKTDEPVDFIDTLDNLEQVLRTADIVVLSIPNTNSTRGMFNAERLGWMKPDAILINVSRAALVDQSALYEHMVAHPDFMAAIDAWWVEPMRQGKFEIEHPFFDLPNLVASPHNAAAVAGIARGSSRRAAENIKRFLTGGQVTGIANREDYL